MSLEDSIRAKLEKAFNPQSITIVNQSDQHAGHAGSPGTGNSHFMIELYSSAFEGKTRVQAQRMVFDVLAEEMKTSIHALALKASAP